VISISEGALQKYAGKYETTNGDILEIKIDSGKLVAFLSPARKYLLIAASASHFYATAEFLNLQFEMNNGEVSGLTLERYGSSRLLRKIK
jgi:hypothetical protein